ncbi:MAG: zinc ribbon domain-containing protein [Hoeflea sp.]|nr:zinc ribbon domain-containing protein [Hoeflea sp.]
MKLLDLLAKLGILRFGAKKAVYHSAKDMPAEFLMNDVFDAERDLTTAQDIRDVAGVITGEGSAPTFCTQCGKPVAPDQKFCSVCGAKLTD